MCVKCAMSTMLTASKMHTPLFAFFILQKICSWLRGCLKVIMVALCNRADHYIFALWFLSIFFPSSFFRLFFPRLISAVRDWMSTILLHMAWPLCEFRMQVWNLLHAARCKYRTQKVAKNRHLGTIAQLRRAISSQIRHVSTIGKKTC